MTLPGVGNEPEAASLRGSHRLDGMWGSFPHSRLRTSKLTVILAKAEASLEMTLGPNLAPTTQPRRGRDAKATCIDVRKGGKLGIGSASLFQYPTLGLIGWLWMSHFNPQFCD